MTDRTLLMTPAAVLDALSRAIVATDTEGHILSWNRAAEVLYGWAAEEVLGRNLLDVLVPAGASAGAIERARTGKGWTGELTARHKDGRPLRVQVVDRPVVDDDGRVVAVVRESEDLSEERRLHAELQASRDEQRLALAAGRLGVLRWDRETTAVTLDETAEHLLGLQPGEFDGTYGSW